MIDVSTGLCIYCGSERPRDSVRCPSCERMWPDRPVTAIRVDLADAEADEPTDADEPTEQDQGGRQDRQDGDNAGTSGRQQAAAAIDPEDSTPQTVEAPSRRRTIAAGIVVLLVVGAAVWFVWPEPGEEAGAPTTQAPPPSSATSSTVPATTTAPTTSLQTTTTLPPTTATTVPPITPIGDAIPLDELTLGAFAMGPLDFGDPGDEAIGRLTATFGQPSAVIEGGEPDGLCEGQQGTVYSWQGLSVVVAGADPGQLAAYSLQRSGGAAPDLETLSGIGIGDSWDLLVSTYGSVTRISLEDGPGYVVSRSSDGRTLLWGTLDDGGDDATVTSIHSPRPCDAGPTP